MEHHCCRRVSSTPSIMTRGKSWDGGSLVWSIMSRLDFFSIVKSGKFDANFMFPWNATLLSQSNGAGQTNRPMLRSQTHQNQEARAEGEGEAFIIWFRSEGKLQKFINIKHLLYCAGCGGDQSAEKVFKSTHYSFHRSLWKSWRGDHYHIY